MAASDSAPPRLVSLAFPGRINVGVSTYPVFMAGATDSGTGVDHVTITLDRARFSYGGSDLITIGGSRALFEEGPQGQAVYFAYGGTYGIASVAVYDRAGNFTTYSATQLAALGIATSFMVAGSGAEDTTKPVLTSLTLPGTVDLTQGQGHVILVANARDTGTGPATVQLTIDHGVGVQTLFVNGDALSGSIDLYGNAPAGTYHILAATVTDQAGNAQSYTGAELDAMQIRTSFEVVSNTPADDTAPVLTGLTLPGEVDLTHGTAAVPISATVEETGTGVAQIAITLDHAITLAFSEGYASHSNTPMGGPVTTSTIAGGSAGTYIPGAVSLLQSGNGYVLDDQAVYGLPAGVALSALSTDGVYHVTGVRVTDKAGNVSQYDADQLAALGADTTIHVSADTTAPTLTGFNITPSLVPSGGTFDINVSAVDTGTGPMQVLVHTSFENPNLYNSGYDSHHLVLGNFVNGTASYHQAIGRSATTGPYEIYDVIVKDGAGNSTMYTADQLHAMGYVTSFGVVNGRAAGDFDGNGLSDLLWRNTSGAISTWSTDVGGAQQHITKDTFDAAVDASWHPVESFDWNGDNHADIAWRNDNGGLAIWTGRTGDFVQSAYLDYSVPTSWQIAATGDLDGNGQGDLLWRNADGSISSWLAQGTGFAKNAYFHGPVDAGWQIAGLGDFNGDGKADILWRNTNGAVSVWNSTGTGFQEGSLLHAPVDRAWHIDGIGDFDGNGRDDILWRNDDGQLTVWQGNGQSNGFDEVRFNASAATDWHVAAVGDYSGDHRADILWRNDAGAVSIWNSDGTGWQQNTYFDAGVGHEWSLVAHDYVL